MKKTIITVVGNDTVGIIAKVCTYLAQNQVNILDISQTIVQGYFNMMMVAADPLNLLWQKSWRLMFLRMQYSHISVLWEGYQ